LSFELFFFSIYIPKAPLYNKLIQQLKSITSMI